MTSVLTLADIRANWNDILDLILREDRIAWLAYFDARLADFDGALLTLDFSDSQKFGSAHEYSFSREKHKQILQRSIAIVLGQEITVAEK